MGKYWKAVRRTRSGKLRSALNPRTDRNCRLDELGTWRDVEYVPGKPTEAPRPEAPLFVCRTLRDAKRWTGLAAGCEVWRCETKPIPERSVFRSVWDFIGGLPWGTAVPVLVSEVTLTERVEASP